MNGQLPIDPADLALYAMDLLPQEEAVTIARRVESSDEWRAALAEVQAELRMFAEGSVALEEPPAASRERLLRAVGREKKFIAPSSAAPVAEPMFGAGAKSDDGGRRGLGKVLPWVGWAAAAGIALTTTHFYRQNADLHQVLSGQQATQSTEQKQGLDERNALRTSVATQTQQIQEMTAAADHAERARTTLQASIAEQNRKLGEVAERAATAARERDALRMTVSSQTGELAQLTAQISAANREHDALEARLNTETNDLQRLTADASRARQVLEVLTNRSAQRVTLTRTAGRVETIGRATYVPGTGSLVFLASNLQPLAPNKTYELWIIPADGTNPVAAGLFRPDERGDASVILPTLPKNVAAKAFGVTVENEGGAAAPTMPILLQGV